VLLAQPDQQPGGNRQVHGDEDVGLPFGLALEQAEAHPGVVGEHDVEEAGDGDAARRRHDQREDRPLAQLVEQQDEGGEGEAALHRGRRALYCAAAPRCCRARRERVQISGASVPLPTSGSTLQQRSHFSPPASSATTATPWTSGRRKASAGAGASLSVMSEVMHTSAKSTAATASLSSGRSIWTTGCACRLEPMRLAARSTSSAPVTTRRTSRTFAHLAARSLFSHSPGT